MTQDELCTLFGIEIVSHESGYESGMFWRLKASGVDANYEGPEDTPADCLSAALRAIERYMRAGIALEHWKREL